MTLWFSTLLFTDVFCINLPGSCFDFCCLLPACQGRLLKLRHNSKWDNIVLQMQKNTYCSKNYFCNKKCQFLKSFKQLKKIRIWKVGHTIIQCFWKQNQISQNQIHKWVIKHSNTKHVLQVFYIQKLQQCSNYFMNSYIQYKETPTFIKS